MTGMDLDAIRAQTAQLITNLTNTAEQAKQHEHPAKGGDLYCLNLTSYMGERMPTVLRLLAAEQAEVDRLRAELDGLKPVAFSSGGQLYIHGCRNAEWWHEATQGPINDQGCDACESAPFTGGWQPVYVRDTTRAGQPAPNPGAHKQ